MYPFKFIQAYQVVNLYVYRIINSVFLSSISFLFVYDTDCHVRQLELPSKLFSLGYNLLSPVPN